jgi:hypothetical protein
LSRVTSDLAQVEGQSLGLIISRRLRPDGLIYKSVQLWSGCPPGISDEKGWITLRHAWHLFSRMDEEEAFGEMDKAGKRALAEFAAHSTHRSEFNFMPTEGRVYFTRR